MPISTSTAVATRVATDAERATRRARAARSTAPAGLAGRTHPDTTTSTVYEVFGLSIGGEVLGLGDHTDGLLPLRCVGLPAVRAAIATHRHGWDVAGDPVVVADDTQPDPEHPLAHGIELPSLMKVHAWRVVDVAAETSELWVNDAGAATPLSQLY